MNVSGLEFIDYMAKDELIAYLKDPAPLSNVLATYEIEYSAKRMTAKRTVHIGEQWASYCAVSYLPRILVHFMMTNYTIHGHSNH